MGKSAYSITPVEETNQLTFIRQSMRILSSPCKGPSLVWPAESASDLHHFRLNSRDNLRERSTTDKADNAYGLSSLRIAQGLTADKSCAKPTAVSISVHHSKTTDFGDVKHDHDVESTSTPEPRWDQCRGGPCASSQLCLILCCPFEETSINAAIHHAGRDIVVRTMMMQITLIHENVLPIFGVDLALFLITVQYL